MSSMDFGGKPDESISDFDRRVFDSISKGQWLPNAFKQYLVEYLTVNQPLIPVGQLVGFSQFTAQVAPMITGDQSTASTSYVNLTTVGPTLTGLPDGQYLFWHGCLVKSNTAGTFALQNLQFDSDAVPIDDGATGTDGTAYVGASVAITRSFSGGGNHSATAKYRVSGGATGNFRYRWLIALRYAN